MAIIKIDRQRKESINIAVGDRSQKITLLDFQDGKAMIDFEGKKIEMEYGMRYDFTIYGRKFEITLDLRKEKASNINFYFNVPPQITITRPDYRQKEKLEKII